MATTYRPLPTPPAPTGDQTMTQYGLQIFGFVLAHGCTATLDDRQVELAISASLYAIAAADLLDSTRTRYTDARRALADCQDRRRRFAATPPTDGATGAYGVDRLDLGPMAQPPGGAAATVIHEDAREYARFDI